jgi:hypothetical protein
MLQAVAGGARGRYAETLTGFKWIVRGGPGWCTGTRRRWATASTRTAVRDKDGIAAAVLACDLAATLKAEGAGLPDRLDALAREHGVHATAGVSVRMEPAAATPAVERLRAAPPAGWTTERPAPDVLVLRRDGNAWSSALGHGAEAEGVPRGGRAARRRRARRPGPRRRPHGRAARRGGGPVARLLIVHHTPSPATAELLDAAVTGARDPEITGVDGGAAGRASRPGPPTCSPPTPCCSARPPTSATCPAR